MIRVDDPFNIKILSNKIPIGIQDRSASDWKDLANQFFNKKDYQYANECYARGINYYDENSIVTDLLNNRSLCYMKLHKHKLALINIIASKYINSSNINHGKDKYCV